MLTASSIIFLRQRASHGCSQIYREKLDAEIASILSTGVEVHTEVTVGKDISFEQLHKDYDCLYTQRAAASPASFASMRTGAESSDRHPGRGQQERHVCGRDAACHR